MYLEAEERGAGRGGQVSTQSIVGIMALLKTIFSETYWMQLDECVSEHATIFRMGVHRVQILKIFLNPV